MKLLLRLRRPFRNYTLHVSSLGAWRAASLLREAFGASVGAEEDARLPVVVVGGRRVERQRRAAHSEAAHLPVAAVVAVLGREAAHALREAARRLSHLQLRARPVAPSAPLDG